MQRSVEDGDRQGRALADRWRTVASPRGARLVVRYCIMYEKGNEKRNALIRDGTTKGLRERTGRARGIRIYKNGNKENNNDICTAMRVLALKAVHDVCDL